MAGAGFWKCGASFIRVAYAKMPEMSVHNFLGKMPGVYMQIKPFWFCGYLWVATVCFLNDELGEQSLVDENPGLDAKASVK